MKTNCGKYHYWHFVQGNSLRHDMNTVRVEPGLALRFYQHPILRERGLHASRRALDALKYAKGATACKVTLGGIIVCGTDQCAAQERTVLAMADATRALHEFAIWCAEQALSLVPADQRDLRSIEALAVKRQWLDGKATKRELVAAWDAAQTDNWKMSRAVAWDSKWSMAQAAATTATADIFWSASKAAAWASAWDEVWRAAWETAWDTAQAISWEAAREAAWDAAARGEAFSWPPVWKTAKAEAMDAAMNELSIELEKRLDALLETTKEVNNE